MTHNKPALTAEFANLAKRIPVGISSCLLGENVRYDGGHKYHHNIAYALGQYFEFHSFCPEVSIGLGVPREPVRLLLNGNEVRCIGTQTRDLDVTEQLVQCGLEQQKWLQGMYAYIFKQGSPSCGLDSAKIFREGELEICGTGLYADTVLTLFPELPVAEERQLDTPEQLKQFIQRVLDYQRKRDTQGGE